MSAERWIEADAYVFDIDGTLLNATGGAHYNAFHSALEKVFGLTCKIDGVPLHGNTDIGILRAVLEREGITGQAVDQKLPAMLRHMCSEVERNRAQLRSTICPGIAELVHRLAVAGKLLGVASGNLESIGWIKVEAAGLRQYFRFGAFSDHYEHREDIFRHAMQLVTKELGEKALTCIVGDTPADIKAAKAVGVPVIVAATGIYSKTELEQHGPDLAVQDCTELLPFLQPEV